MDEYITNGPSSAGYDPERQRVHFWPADRTLEILDALATLRLNG